MCRQVAIIAVFHPKMNYFGVIIDQKCAENLVIEAKNRIFAPKLY